MKKNDCRNASGWILTILLFVVAAVTAQAAPGDLDTTFNGTGKLRTVIGGGTLDATFDGDGMAVVQVGEYSGTFAKAVAIQSDGAIVVAGDAAVGSSGSATTDFVVVRFLPTGALDTLFGTNGKVTTAINLRDDILNPVAIQPDGKIVAAGYAYNNSNYDFAVVRYKANGSLDSSYNADGKITVDLSGDNDYGYAIALDSSGRAVVVGGSNYLFGIVRILGNLSPTAAQVSISGRVLTPTGRGLTGAMVWLTDGSGSTRSARTTAFG